MAAQRSYDVWKQDPVWQGFSSESTGGTQTRKEYSRTLKYNTNLRFGGRQIRRGVIRKASNTVLLGDGMSLDLAPWPDGQSASSMFSMKVERFQIPGASYAGVGLRHDGGANILFNDGHAGSEKLPTFERSVYNGSTVVKAWEHEFDGYSNSAPRNPNMPLIWSNPDTFIR